MTTLQVKRRPVGRLSVAVGVQICSNASNFLLTMAVARAMTTDAVGVYAVIMSVTGILVGLVRAYTGEPISFGERAVADLEARGRAQRAVASSLVLGVCTVLLVTPLMLVALPDYKDAVVFFAVFAPFAIAQDCLRFVLVAGGHLTRALASEATWLLTQTAFLLLLLSFDSLSAMISAWGVGAIAAFIVGLRAYGFRLPFRSTWVLVGAPATSG